MCKWWVVGPDYYGQLQHKQLPNSRISYFSAINNTYVPYQPAFFMTRFPFSGYSTYTGVLYVRTALYFIFQYIYISHSSQLLSIIFISRVHSVVHTLCCTNTTLLLLPFCTWLHLRIVLRVSVCVILQYHYYRT